MNDSQKSIRLSVNVQNQLNELHQRIGDFKRSTGVIYAIYDRYRSALYADFTDIFKVRTLFRGLQAEIWQTSHQSLVEAEMYGIDQFNQTSGIFNLDNLPPSSNQNLIAEYLGGIQTLLQNQKSGFIGLLLSGEVNRDLFLGEGPSWGVLTPRPIITTLKNFTASVLNSVMNKFGLFPEMGFQAIAILDKKTSPCCRAVDGQVQPIGEPFHLTEPPHYSDYMLMPPFHDGCRTTRAFVKLSEVQ